MNYVQIIPNLPKSSKLAFGCSGVAGRIGKKKSLEAIHAAIDHGITHFDVAPSYGYGDAESCVGVALKNKRDKIVVATKVGILPVHRMSFFKKSIKPIAQTTIRVFPKARKLISMASSFSGTSVKTNQFSIDQIKISVEKSLLTLKTDYLDILFLHEYKQNDLPVELVDCLDTLKKQGKIRADGLATDIDTINYVNNHNHNLLPQFSNNVLLKNHNKLKKNNCVYITHSSFSGIDHIKRIVQDNKNIFQTFGLWPLPERELYELMLHYTFSVNRFGIVICSMLRKSHLKDNISMLEYPKFSEEQVMYFAETIGKHLSETHQSI